MIIKNLSFSYGKSAIFQEFNFESHSEIIVLKGPSGCGKTTLLKLISGNLLPSNLAKMTKFITTCMIIQEDALFPWLTGIDNIKKALKLSKNEITNHPMYLCIEPFVNKLSCEMSYGQRRLIELFRVFLLKPQLLCLDEPFNFLDPSSRKIVTEILKNTLKKKSDSKIILSSHYNEDLIDIGAEVFYFNGNFPISDLSKNNLYAKKN